MWSIEDCPTFERTDRKAWNGAEGSPRKAWQQAQEEQHPRAQAVETKSEWLNQEVGVSSEEAERAAQIERGRQRVRELNQNPEFIAALREIEETADQSAEENPELCRALEAGEFKREATVRRYGQDYADGLKRPQR